MDLTTKYTPAHGKAFAGMVEMLPDSIRGRISPRVAHHCLTRAYTDAVMNSLDGESVIDACEILVAAELLLGDNHYQTDVTGARFLSARTYRTTGAGVDLLERLESGLRGV